MAEALDNGEFWLPSEFLTDDDILMGTHKFDIGANLFCFPSEFPSGSLNSPVESLVGSTETESDEDDYLSGFTRQMAKSLLETNNSKTRVMAGSPQSPLCGIGSWSGKSSGSSNGSPNDGPSLVSSPPSTPSPSPSPSPSLNGKDDSWDLLYAAAGQVVRMKLNDEVPNYVNNRGLLGVPQKAAASVNNVGGYSNQVLTQQQLQANHFYQLKQQQQQQQQLQQCSSAWGRQVRPSSGPQQTTNTGRSVGLVNGRCNTRPLGLPPSAWPTLQQQHQQQQQQQQNGSGMRAVFLGGSGTRRESTGTGVFLPRRNGNSSDSRRKPTCSTVLLPARVVQALNLNFEDMGNGGGSVNHQSRYGSVHGNAYLLQAQKRSYHRPQPAIINNDLQLPQEWTY